MRNPSTTKAYFAGSGIGSLAAAAFLIRDGDVPGKNITIFEAAAISGGSLDGAGTPSSGYSMRGGRMLTSDNYECTWDLFKSIPSLWNPGQSVFDETAAFNLKHPSNSKARLVDRHRAKTPVASMGFSMQDRVDLLRLIQAGEEVLGNDRITDSLSPGFFDSQFWFLWSTTFAFQPWHSAVEFRRYLLRFLLEFKRIETLAGVKRTVYNQYDSLVLPLDSWLKAQGVNMVTQCAVTAIEHRIEEGKFVACELQLNRAGVTEMVPICDGDLVFIQNGSMTDASSIGSATLAPAKLGKSESSSWKLWESLALQHPEFGRPAVFNACIAQSSWQSFTVTLQDHSFFNEIERFTGNQAGIGGLVTFKDSNWLLSIVLAHQPHFPNQPENVQVFWGYSLYPDRIGNFVPKAMEDCSGDEILCELRGHLRMDGELFETANCIPCRMPYITSQFMPRNAGDRPLPVPAISHNLAFLSQFVEIADDVVFTVEYSVRAAQMAVYELMGIARKVPPVTPHAHSLHTQFDALVKAFE